MPYPVEAGEITDFTPETLSNIPVPPVFKLRAGSWRDERDYRHALIAEGLTWHGPGDFRAETLRAFKAGWTPESYETGKDRLLAYWDAVDQAEAQRVEFEFDQREASQLEALQDDIKRSWPNLSRMAADNIMFGEMAPRVALTLFLCGFAAFDLQFRREGGRVPVSMVDDIAEKLSGIEAENAGIEGIGAPGTAFIQLCTAALMQMKLTRQEEKNSSSPSSINTNLEPSENGAETTAPSPSKASARSTSKRSA